MVQASFCFDSRDGLIISLLSPGHTQQINTIPHYSTQTEGDFTSVKREGHEGVETTLLSTHTHTVKGCNQ